jgi:hypothetical protein
MRSTVGSLSPSVSCLRGTGAARHAQVTSITDIGLLRLHVRFVPGAEVNRIDILNGGVEVFSEEDNLYFRLARCMQPKAGAGEQGGQDDDGQRGSIGEAVAL